MSDPRERFLIRYAGGFGPFLVYRPADALGAAVTAECVERGLSMKIVRAGTRANCFRMAPPLTIAEDEIDLAEVQ